MNYKNYKKLKKRSFRRLWIQRINAAARTFGTTYSKLMPALSKAGIEMDLLFRTDEHVLADTTGARLAELAGSLASKPEIRLQLDGFADERGNEDYNLKLSEKRVLFVRDQLISAGVDPRRIRISAHGEAPAQDDSTDSYALERRVSLKLFIENSQPFASSP